MSSPIAAVARAEVLCRSQALGAANTPQPSGWNEEVVLGGRDRKGGCPEAPNSKRNLGMNVRRPPHSASPLRWRDNAGGLPGRGAGSPRCLAAPAVHWQGECADGRGDPGLLAGSQRGPAGACCTAPTGTRMPSSKPWNLVPTRPPCGWQPPTKTSTKQKPKDKLLRG